MEQARHTHRLSSLLSLPEVEGAMTNEPRKVGADAPKQQQGHTSAVYEGMDAGEHTQCWLWDKQIGGQKLADENLDLFSHRHHTPRRKIIRKPGTFTENNPSQDPDPIYIRRTDELAGLLATLLTDGRVKSHFPLYYPLHLQPIHPYLRSPTICRPSHARSGNQTYLPKPAAV